MKKGLCAILGVLFLFSISATFSTVSAKTEWKIGYQDQIIQSKQRENGWYFLYSKEHNKGKAFPVDSLKECIWDNKVSSWKYYAPQTDGYVWGVPKEDIDKKFYNPDKKPKPVENVWFQINCVGKEEVDSETNKLVKRKGVRCDPGALITPAIKWLAPSNGKFSLNAEFTAGTAVDYALDDSWDLTPMDGVTYSICHNNTVLKNESIPWSKESNIRNTNKFPVQNFKKDVDMKKGDSLYFIVDPNKTHDYDFSKWIITIKLTGGSDSQSSKNDNSQTAKPNDNSKPKPDDSKKTQDSTLKPDDKSLADVSNGIKANNDSTTDVFDTANTGEDGVIANPDWDNETDTSKSSTNNKTPEKSKTWLIILIILLAVLVLGGIPAIYIIVKKKKEQDYNNTDI